MDRKNANDFSAHLILTIYSIPNNSLTLLINCMNTEDCIFLLS